MQIVKTTINNVIFIWDKIERILIIVMMSTFLLLLLIYLFVNPMICYIPIELTASSDYIHAWCGENILNIKKIVLALFVEYVTMVVLPMSIFYFIWMMTTFNKYLSDVIESNTRCCCNYITCAVVQIICIGIRVCYSFNDTISTSISSSTTITVNEMLCSNIPLYRNMTTGELYVYNHTSCSLPSLDFISWIRIIFIYLHLAISIFRIISILCMIKKHGFLTFDTQPKNMLTNQDHIFIYIV
jgi:hypothetical protein